MKKNAFYAQSGGVTSVINATASALILESKKYKSKIGKVYAGKNGILGALREDLIDTSKENISAIKSLRETPGGVFGSLLSTPILNPPQTAILGMHKIQERPMAVNGQVVVLPMMYLALSYDHRMIDGKDAVQFLVAIKDMLEDPARMLLDV